MFCRLHIPSTEVQDRHIDWTKRAEDNEDLLVFYGICKNYQALVVRGNDSNSPSHLPRARVRLTRAAFIRWSQEALLETDSVMYNGDDMHLVRAPVMLHAHAWTAQDLASTFSPAGQGPSWYRLGLNPNNQ